MSDNKIRTIPLKGTTYFSELDILKAFGLTKANAYKNVKGFVNVEVAPVRTKVGNAMIRVKARVLPVATVEAIAKANNIRWNVAGQTAPEAPGCKCGVSGCKVPAATDWSEPKYKAGVQSVGVPKNPFPVKYQPIGSVKHESKQDTEIKGLKKQVDDLKALVAQLLTEQDSSKKSLQLRGKSASITNDRLQPEARKKIREVVEDYADRRSKELGITDPQNRSIFYDLSYKALYNEYKRQTPNHIDLKEEADRQSKFGIKVSALQVAEQKGVAVELLNLAKTLFGSK